MLSSIYLPIHLSLSLSLSLSLEAQQWLSGSLVLVQLRKAEKRPNKSDKLLTGTYWSISSKKEHPSTCLYFKNKATESYMFAINLCA